MRIENKTYKERRDIRYFAVFNTDNNHSVVQTYNFTTYKLCDYDDASENDTTEWSAADPSATTPYAVMVAVPLVKEGPNYFFSGNYDGEQCQNGQQFKINVTHGQGLPKSMGDPSDEAPAPVVPDTGDQTEAAPDTIVPSSFDNPRNDVADNDKESSSSNSISLVYCFKFNEFFFLLIGIASACFLSLYWVILFLIYYYIYFLFNCYVLQYSNNVGFSFFLVFKQYIYIYYI